MGGMQQPRHANALSQHFGRSSSSISAPGASSSFPGGPDISRTQKSSSLAKDPAAVTRISPGVKPAFCTASHGLLVARRGGTTETGALDVHVPGLHATIADWLKQKGFSPRIAGTCEGG